MSVWTRTLKATPPERQDPPPAEPAPEGLRNPPLLFPLPDVRHDFLLHEGADRLPQELVLGREEPGHFLARSRSRARSSVRRILPLIVLGRSGTNSISRGCL